MPYMNNNIYREIPFCIETPYNDFYTYVDLKKIPEKCEDLIERMIRCRTIGILQSLNGRYYLSDFDSSGADSKPLVQISVVYMQVSPPSTIIPYPVQIFGSLQWKNRPVIYAKILQVLKTPMALRLKNTLRSISTHLATSAVEIQDDDYGT